MARDMSSRYWPGAPQLLIDDRPSEIAVDGESQATQELVVGRATDRSSRVNDEVAHSPHSEPLLRVSRGAATNGVGEACIRRQIFDCRPRRQGHEAGLGLVAGDADNGAASHGQRDRGQSVGC
jgi:hypothetical protein